MNAKEKQKIMEAAVVGILAMIALTLAICIVSTLMLRLQFEEKYTEPAVSTPAAETDERNIRAASAIDAEIVDAVYVSGDVTTEPVEIASDTGLSYKVSDDVPLDEDLQIFIQSLCTANDVPYELVLGVIETESSFQPYAQSSSSVGYMQINTCNAAWLTSTLGTQTIYEPHDNIRAGIYMLKMLYDKYGDWHPALVAYNCGDGGAYSSYFSRGVYSSDYSWIVMERAQKWGEILGC